MGNLSIKFTSIALAFRTIVALLKMKHFPCSYGILRVEKWLKLITKLISSHLSTFWVTLSKVLISPTILRILKICNAKKLLKTTFQWISIYKLLRMFTELLSMDWRASLSWERDFFAYYVMPILKNSYKTFGHWRISSIRIEFTFLETFAENW